MKKATQAHTGRYDLIDRLAAQIKHSGFRGDPYAAAVSQLQKRGQMDTHGEWTEAGRKRDAMTAEERALDRASKKHGKPTKAFVYDSKTNRARLK